MKEILKNCKHQDHIFQRWIVLIKGNEASIRLIDRSLMAIQRELSLRKLKWALVILRENKIQIL